MRPRSESVLAIWLASIGIGLLFLARGAFQNYIFPLFENLGNFSYARIALLVNGYGLAQSVCAPLAGWYTDRTSVRFALATSIVFGLCSFLLISTSPGYLISVIAVLIAGLAFILGKISLNTILVLHSSAETLRRSVAKRATLLNLGSFFGNSVAVYMIAHAGYRAHAVMLALLYLPLAIGLAAPAIPAAAAPRKKSSGGANFKMLCHNRGFLADALRRFALVLPYGCWGTIIPKYVIDQYHSNNPVWIVSLTSVCTTIVGAHFLAVHVSAMLYRRGFKWEWWSMTSVLFYCVGLILLMFARHPVMLPIAIVVFICGEVLMTPCFDETAKKHSGESGMGTCMGLLHLVDGFGKTLGAAFALAVYGWMRNTSYQGFYWPVVASAFLVACTVLHVAIHVLARNGEGAACNLENAAATLEQQQAAFISGPES
jgi:MFS family permease